MVTKSAGSDATVSSNTFGVDCISNVSDRSPDSDSERDSGSMMIVRLTELIALLSQASELIQSSLYSIHRVYVQYIYYTS